MRELVHLASCLYNAPLMVDPGKGEIIEQIFHSKQTGTPLTIEVDDEVRPMAFANSVSAKRTEAGYLRTNDGVALIPILGTLMQRGSSMDAASGLQSYQRLTSQLNAAMGDPAVRGILLEIDSMGGQANGVFELAAQIRAMSALKPITAVANEEAMSAAYLLGSAAQELYLPETGMVGSVGVVMYHVDRSRYLEKQGIVYTPIFAGARKVDMTPYAPLSKEAEAWAKDSVNRTYAHFVQAVAQYRGINAEAVRATEGVMLHADQAVQQKFVTGIATFAEVLQRMTAKLQGGVSTTVVYGARASASNAHPKESQMNEQDKQAAAPSSGQEAQQLQQSQQNVDTLVATARKEGMTAERKRIGQILGCDEAKTRQGLARHIATETELSAEQAQAMLKAAPPEGTGTTNLLAAHMANTPNPEVGVSSGQASASDAPKRIDSAQIYSMRQESVKQAKAH